VAVADAVAVAEAEEVAEVEAVAEAVAVSEGLISITVSKACAIETDSATDANDDIIPAA
jgi:hypothetical protein